MTQKIEKDAQKFWEGSKSNQFVQDMSHFRGSDRWSGGILDLSERRFLP